MKKLILGLLIGACAYLLAGCTTSSTPAANATNAAPANSTTARRWPARMHQEPDRLLVVCGDELDQAPTRDVRSRRGTRAHLPLPTG